MIDNRRKPILMKFHFAGLWSMFPLRCATVKMRISTRTFAQRNRILAHFQYSRTLVMQKNKRVF